MDIPVSAADRLRTARFTRMLIRENGLTEEFASWVFCSGMQFNSPDKWWGDHGRRDYPHEGLDFCMYRSPDGRIGRLDENTRVPAVQDGTVVAMFKDFLGQAVVVEHRSVDTGSAGRLLTFYAHTRPVAGLAIGSRVVQGEVVAAIAHTRHSKAGIRPHLHFSLGLASGSISYQGFQWNTIRSAGITLLDPLSVLDGHHEFLEAGTALCGEL